VRDASHGWSAVGSPSAQRYPARSAPHTTQQQHAYCCHPLNSYESVKMRKDLNYLVLKNYDFTHSHKIFIACRLLLLLAMFCVEGNLLSWRSISAANSAPYARTVSSRRLVADRRPVGSQTDCRRRPRSAAAGRCWADAVVFTA
jgi:hypothetical protein